jgi:hypothetical protein
MVQKVNESSYNYIGLDGLSLIIESEFNFANAETISPSSVGTVQQVQRKKDDLEQNKKEDQNKVGGKYLLQDKEGYEYYVRGGVWHFKKNDTKLVVLTNPKSIKELITLYPKAGGYYITTKMENGKWIRANKNLYKFDKGAWYVQLNGSTDWQKSTSEIDLSRLKDMYGSSISSVSSEKEKQMATADLDKEFKAISEMIKKYIEGDGNFDAYKSSLNDNEERAWNEAFIPYWDDYIAPKIKKIKSAISLLQNEPLKAKYQRNIEIFRKMRWDKDSDDGLYDTFSGGNDSDEFTWTIRLSDTTKTYTVDTDF